MDFGSMSQNQQYHWFKVGLLNQKGQEWTYHLVQGKDDGKGLRITLILQLLQRSH